MTLSDFLSSPDPIIRDAAVRLQGLNAKLATREITVDEYRELVGDQLDYDAIQADIDSTTRKIQIEQAFRAMIALAEIAMTFKP